MAESSTTPPSDSSPKKDTPPTEPPAESGLEGGEYPTESSGENTSAAAPPGEMSDTELTPPPSPEESPDNYESPAPAEPLPSEANKSSAPPSPPSPPAKKSSTPPPRDPEPEEEESGTKPFLDHLEDLRWTIVKCASALFVCTCFTFYALPWILEFLEAPLKATFPDPSKIIQVTGPGTIFIVSIKIALYAGFLLALPFLLFFIGQFVLPALTHKEKGYLWPAFTIGGGLFFTGAAFCYYWIMPRALGVSVQWGEWMHVSTTFWRVEEYVSFICGFMVGLGVAFETPVVIMTLVKIGILTSQQLRKARRYWIVFSLVAGSLLTTPEVFTQLVMAAVLCVLYEISILGAMIIERRAARK